MNMSVEKQYVDARGVSCPEPVLLTKKALAQNCAQIEIIVDNHTAKGNVERFLRISGYRSEVEEKNGEFKILARK